VPGRLAAQLGRPRGLVGRLVVRSLNRGNAATNRRAVELLDLAPGHRALDLGFGGGVGLAALLDSPAAQVTGVDHSGDMVARARRRFAGPLSDGRLRLAEASVESLPFGDGEFDRILSVHTVYFWPDPPAAARELRRVIAPGGRLVLALGRKEWMERQRVHRTGFTLYDEREVEELLRGGGFGSVRLEGDGPLYAVAEP
jgi:ubiquinone/menaquinone biosynthesis C-methylase UbiE